MCGVMFSQRYATLLKKDNRKVSSSCVYVCVCVCVCIVRGEKIDLSCAIPQFLKAVYCICFSNTTQQKLSTLCVCVSLIMCACVSARVSKKLVEMCVFR